MPVYSYKCGKCGRETEVITSMSWLATGVKPKCCDEVMGLTIGAPLIRIKYPLWVDRIDDIQKRETQNGERMRFVHPKEVQAT